jgi:phage baseplate assembly protein W
MELHGSVIDFPPRIDPKTGSLVTTSDKQRIIRQAIEDILETRKFERVMIPDYGLPDFLFAAVDAGFAARIAFHLRDQIDKYCPLVEAVTARADVDDSGRAVVTVTYRERASHESPRNLTFPVWQYVGKTAE